ncbi:hypothetical protein D3C83_265400 [compost metagenome]
MRIAPVSARNISRPEMKLSVMLKPQACNSCGRGVGQGTGVTFCVPRVSQSAFLITARMISEMPIVAIAR